MAANDRKKNILKHLQTTSDLNLTPKKSRTTSIESSAPATPVTPETLTTPETPVTPEIPVTPTPKPVVAKKDDCNLQIMTHLNLSSNYFNVMGVPKSPLSAVRRCGG